MKAEALLLSVSCNPISKLVDMAIANQVNHSLFSLWPEAAAAWFTANGPWVFKEIA
jgi:hypothetical protein